MPSFPNAAPAPRTPGGAPARILPLPTGVSTAARIPLKPMGATPTSVASQTSTQVASIMMCVSADGAFAPRDLHLGNVLHSPSGTTRKLVGYKPGTDGGVGELVFEVTKEYSGDNLIGKFTSEPNEHSMILDEEALLSLDPSDVIYHVDAGKNGFTIVEIKKDGEKVNGVVLRYNQSFPDNTQFDFVQTVEEPKE